MTLKRRIVKTGNITFSQEETNAVLEVCKSNRVTEGEKTAEFEKQWAKTIGTKYAVCVNSGTSGLIAGLYSLKYIADNPKRKKVITTPITFVATSNSIVISGLEPIFADVTKDTFAIMPSQIEKILQENNPEEFLAIVPVHMMGYPCEMDEITRIAKKNGLYVFEDAAQAHGSRYHGQTVGSIGDLANYSFYVMHNVQVGEFGAVNTNNPDINRMLRKVKAHGRICICDKCRRLEGKCPQMAKDSKEDIDPRYSHDVIGFNFKTNEFMSTLALERLKQMDKINRIRAKNVEYLNSILEKHSDILQLPPFSEEVSYLGYPLVLKKGNRGKIRKELEKKGIETRVLFGCIPTQQKSFEHLKDKYLGKLPNAEYLGRNGFFIGCHQDLIQEDLDYIAQSFGEILR